MVQIPGELYLTHLIITIPGIHDRPRRNWTPRQRCGRVTG
jgi:hypothetical protein